MTCLLTIHGRKKCEELVATLAGSSAARLWHLRTAASCDPRMLDEQRVHRLVTRSPACSAVVHDAPTAA